MDCLKNIMKFEKKLSNSIKIGFDSEPAYNEKYLTTKIKSYKGKINTNFHNNKIPKKGFWCIFPSVILVNSVFRLDINYNLEESKYVGKKKKKKKKKRKINMLLMI